MTYHGNARTNMHQRNKIHKSREPYRLQAERLGVSIATVAKWKRRSDARDRHSRPHHIHKALPTEMAPVLSFMRRDWLLDLDTVWQALRTTVFPQLSRSSCYRELVRLQLHQLHSLRPSFKRIHGKFRASPPGFLHIDTFYLPRLDGKKRYLFVAIDRATRLMTLRIYDSRDAASGQSFLDHCLVFYPFRIYRVLTDNGPEYTNRRYRNGHVFKVHAFGRLCREHRIRHTMTKPYHPWTNGLAERTGGIIKNEVIHRLHFDCLARMQEAIFGFRRYFNECRPYRVMGGKTPIQLVEQWYIKDPKRFLMNPKKAFATW